MAKKKREATAAGDDFYEHASLDDPFPQGGAWARCERLLTRRLFREPHVHAALRCAWSAW